MRIVRALEAFYRASPRLTLCLAATALLSGGLLPAFMLASGGLVAAVSSGQDFSAPLALVAAIFVAQRVLDPIREELGAAVWRRVNQAVGLRLMGAASAPPGLRELEDPAVRDKLAQAEGAISGFTPGQAAQEFAMSLVGRVQGVLSLAIVARTYWWAAVFLALVYALNFSRTRGHWKELLVVLNDRTGKMRRSFYLRGLALSSREAKETRVFDLCAWLIEGYRRNAFAVLREVWNKRNEGWLAAVVLVVLVGSAEMLTLWVIANDSVLGRIDLATAVATAQAVLAAGFLSLYEDGDYALEEAATANASIVALERATLVPKTVHSGAQAADGMPRTSIRFEQVTFTYPGRSEPVLDGLDLEIEAGRSLAIVGENGAGKTTLVKLLARLHDPTSGRITVDGVDVRALSTAAWRRRIAAVFQDFARFELSAYDNIAFGALHAFDDPDKVARAASEAGVLGLVERLEHGWTTTMSREYRFGAELSGGEWQRLALARALFGVAAGAGVLILDEPTASLDVRGEAQVYERFIELTRGVTTIVISHRFSTVRRADRIVVVEHGRVVEDGTHADLVQRRGGRYAALYALQASRFEAPDVDDA
jgi:ATP-binding cassette subfamily B protein